MEEQKKESKLGDYFYLTWKKALIVLIITVSSIILHNLYYKIFGASKTIFSVIALIIIPIYFLIALVYSLFRLFKENKNISRQNIIALTMGFILGILLSVFTRFNGIFFIGAFFLLVSIIMHYLIEFVRKRL